MSFFKKLFGLGSAPETESTPAATTEHNGFTLLATPYHEGGQWQMCGVIEKEIAGEKKSHRFIRADKFGSKEEAAEYTLQKARLIIDQLGEKVFG